MSDLTQILNATARGEPQAERLLPLVYDELRRLAVIAFHETLAVKQGARVGHERRAAADHDAVVRGIERGQPDIAEQLA